VLHILSGLYTAKNIAEFKNIIKQISHKLEDKSKNNIKRYQNYYEFILGKIGCYEQQKIDNINRKLVEYKEKLYK